MQVTAVLDSEGNPTGVYQHQPMAANKGLELIGKELGMFKERIEHSGPLGAPIEISSLDPRLLALNDEELGGTEERVAAKSAGSRGAGGGRTRMIELIELKKPISLADVERVERWRARNRIHRFYPDQGPLRRELYPKHLAFFAAGAEHRERLMMAANRVGKTEGVGAYEVTCHLTGIYPAWWTGKRFRKPVKIWAAGDTSKTVREIVQAKLLGEPGQLGTGMIPGDLISKITHQLPAPDRAAGPAPAPGHVRFAHATYGAASRNRATSALACSHFWTSASSCFVPALVNE